MGNVVVYTPGIGRPLIRTPEVVEEIVNRLANGEGLWKICVDEHMPARATVLRWTREDKDFRDQYESARRLAADAMDDDIDRVARDGGRDIIIEERDGIRVERVDHENIQRSKLIVDALKWRASKMRPDIYGDRLAHQTLDEKGRPAKLEIRVTRVDGKPWQS